MQTTVNDFWVMIMQENVAFIIMLCSVIENRKVKCHQYWPLEEGEKLEFGGNRNLINHQLKNSPKGNYEYS